MGKGKPHDTYETIPANHAKASSRAIIPQDNVRYVKDPVTEPFDSNYAFHITYHTDTTGDDRYATSTKFNGSSTLPAHYPNLQQPAPQRSYSNQTHTLPPTTQHQMHLTRGQSYKSPHHIGYIPNEPQYQMHLTRGASDKSPHRVSYIPSETLGVPVPPNPQGNYTTERLRHFRDEGALVVPYEPASNVPTPGEESKLKKESGKCSSPPWWGWVIIILVCCLIAAVLYFIFGQVLNKSPQLGITSTTSSPRLGSITTSTQSSTLSTQPLTPLKELTTAVSQLQTTTTQQISSMQSVSTTADQGSTTQLSSSTLTPLSTAKVMAPSTTDSSSSISSVDAVDYHDDWSLAFVPTEDTRSIRSPSSKRVLSPSKTVTGCWKDCLLRAAPCFGVDFNEQWLTCHILTTHDYKLEPIGTTHKTHNYRRTFTMKSFCQEALYFHSARTFAYHINYRTQPGSVNTMAKCRTACLGPYYNGMLQGGYRCTAGVFNMVTKTCRITNVAYYPNMLTDSSSSTHFLNDGVECIQIPKAACAIKFSAVKNRQPLDTDARKQQEGVRTVPGCASVCLNYRGAGGATCQGFVFTYNTVNTSDCTVYTGQRSSALGTVVGTDFYGINPPICSRCGYKLSPGTAGSDGIYQDARSRPTCQTRCDNWTPGDEGEVCYGYDVTKRSGSDIACHVITEPAHTVADWRGTDHYGWDPTCRGCNPTSFITTVHTSPLGGATYRQTSLTSCARACQTSISPPTSKRCHGFTFDRSTKDCRHFYNFDYDLNSIGISPNSDHYRRMFACSEDPSLKCNTYNLTMDTAVNSAGVTQPWDIHSVERCKDRCWGYGVSTNQTCYGFDFNIRTSSCTIYLDPQYILGQPGDAPGTNHYTRQVTC